MNFWGKKNNLNIFTHAPPPGKSHHYPPSREKFFIGKHFFKNIILPTEQMGDIAYSFIPFWGEHIFTTIQQ